MGLNLQDVVRNFTNVTRIVREEVTESRGSVKVVWTAMEIGDG